MKKRLLSIILTLCMVLTLLPGVALADEDLGEYGIWVGTANVTSANASNVTGEGITGTVTYDAGTNTLTLKNASITKTGHFGYAIGRQPGDLNIALIGSNTIDLSNVASSNGEFIGIYSSGKVSIKGTTGSSLSIVHAPTTQGFNIGISGSTGVTIEDCAVTVTAGTVTGNMSTACLGISVDNGILSIKNATVTANGGTTAGNSFGISVANGSLVIDNSTITASGGDGTRSYGIEASAYMITISASTVTAKGNTSALYFGVAPTATGLTATASADKGGTGAAAVPIDSSVYSSDSAGSAYKYVQIAPAPLSQQARWGVAGSDGAAPTSWTEGTLADAISYANTATSDMKYIQLLTDIDKSNHSTWPLTFNNTTNPTILDLNGKDINRGLTTAAANGNVITVVAGSILTLKDSSTNTVASQGKITGGCNSINSGGVIVDGSFTMQGGNITGNKSTSTGTGGGGVYVNGTVGAFSMTGGSITNNEALYWGGGVYVNGNSGTFSMTGGSITGNKSANGGVFFVSNFTVGGTAVIKNNTVTGTSTERNVVLMGGTISVSNTPPLTSGASIGVTANSAPTSGSPRSVTGASSANYSSYIIQNGASNSNRQS